MVYMSRSATCDTIGSVLLSRLGAWGLTAERSSHVGRGLRTNPYVAAWLEESTLKQSRNRPVQPGMCHVQVFMGGEDGGQSQVVLTLLSHFTKQVTEAWKALLFAIICFILFIFTLCLIYTFPPVSGVGNYCCLSPEWVLLNAAEYGEWINIFKEIEMFHFPLFANTRLPFLLIKNLAINILGLNAFELNMFDSNR